MYGFRAMNTVIHTYYLDDRQNRQTEAWFRHAEKTLSRFLKDSELSQLNRTKQVPFVASDLLYDAIYAADYFYRETNGMFNPYLGRELCRLGYDKSFEKIESGAIAPVLPEENLVSSRKMLEIDPKMRMITLLDGSIELGGIGKGWTAQQAANQLQKKSPHGGIAAGGDIIVWGMPQEAWNINISDPHAIDKTLYSFKLNKPAGIATSSTIKRSWKDSNGERRHHILDPRTGLSSRSELVQATVLAPDLTTAEVYAKCMIISGWENGIKWLERQRPDLAAVGVEAGGKILAGGALKDYSSEGLICFERPVCEYQ